MSRSLPQHLRKWLKRLVILLCLAPLLPIAAGAIARTPAMRAYAGQEATRALREQLGLTADIAEVDIDPERFEVLVRRVSLDHPTHGRFADAEALRIRPSLWALMRGSLDLHTITIEQATLFLKLREGRIVNLPPMPESESSGEDLDLPFRFFRIKDSRLVVDASPVANLELRNIDIHLDASVADELRAHVSAAGGFVNHAMGSDKLEALELVGGFGHQALQIDRFRFETPAVTVGLRRAQLSLPLGEWYRGAFSLELDVPQLERWPHGWELPPLLGHLSVQAELEGRGDRPEGTARVLLHRGAVDGFGLGERVAVDVHFDRQRVAFEGGVDLVEKGGRVQLDGAVELAEGVPMEVHGNVDGVSFAKLMKQLGVSDNAIVDWQIAGQFSLKGTLSPLALEGPMRMPTRRFQVLRDAWHKSPRRPILGVERALLDGQVRVLASGLYFRNVDITLPSSKLFANVKLGFDNDLDVSARAAHWNLNDVSPLLEFPLGGNGVFDVTVDGSFQDPTVEGAVSVRDFSFNRYRFGDIETDFVIDQDLMGVTFPRIEAKKHDSRYAVVAASLDFRNDAFRAGGDLEIESMEVADFYHTFHYEGDERFEPYQATLEGSARVDYTMDYPGDSENGTMVATFDFDVPHTNLNGYAFRDGHLAGSWKWYDHALGYRGGELRIDRMSMRKGAGTVNVSGKMGLDGKLDLVAIGDRIAFRDTEGFRDRMKGVTGSYGVTATVEGVASRPRMHMDLIGTGMAVHGEPIGDGRAYVRLTDREDPWIAEALGWEGDEVPEGERCAHGRRGFARSSWPEDPPLVTREGPMPVLDQPMAWVVCGQALDGQVQVDLAVGRTEVMPLRGRVRLADLHFGKLLPRSRRGGPMRGTLSGVVDLWEGAMKRPETLAGRVVLDELRAGQLDVELSNSGPVDVRFREGAFDVISANFVGPSSQLYVAGGASLSQGLALRFDGSVDLGLVSTLSDTVTDAAGTLLLEFKVSGPMANPSVYGSAFIQGAALEAASFSHPIDDVTGKVTFTAHRIVLEDFSAKVAGGTLRWDGVAALAGRGIGSYRLNILADGMSLTPRDGIELGFGARTRLEWQKGQRVPKLSGVLDLDQLDYTRPIKMNRSFGELYTATRTEAHNYDPEADLIELDLTVEQSRPLFVRNNLIDAELRIDGSRGPFRLVGTDQRFGVLGQMGVRKGKVRFRDANFEIRQGEISFSDETRVNPSFDLRAVTDISRTSDQTNWHIQIRAWGNRDEFQFKLTSDPYLAEDDIALLLTVGMTHSELAQIETGDLTSSAALEALASVSGVEQEVHRALPEIDDFRIASAYSEQSNRTEPQLFIGKRIAKNLRLSASTGISESRDFSTGVELRLNDETSVEAMYQNQNATSTSQIGDVGVDLKWRLEFD